jgi:uncharacterized membrane protein YhiD involved in acid resistance
MLLSEVLALAPINDRELIIQVFAALISGESIGLDRELSKKAAGFRTYISSQSKLITKTNKLFSSLAKAPRPAKLGDLSPVPLKLGG